MNVRLISTIVWGCVFVGLASLIGNLIKVELRERNWVMVIGLSIVALVCVIIVVFAALGVLDCANREC